MTRAQASAATPASERIDPKRLVAFLAMVFGMFMAILDIQVVSASLAEIQAGLSASADEVAWVQTSYLIAEVIMIPLSGFLSRAFSTRVMFTVSAAGFTLMSFMCATATSINEMIVWRALQGFIGGGMIPAVFAAGYLIFPRSKLPIISPMIGLVATLAPTIGPTVGGYLTDALSWHWLFLINIVPGIIVSIVAWTMIDFDKPDHSLLKDFDWTGLVSMAVFLGALEYVLEDGTAKDWFQSDAIIIGTAASAIGGAIFFWRAFTAKQPIVDLTAFNNRNFWTGCVFSFVFGIGLYGLTYLYPVYLARVRGYSALQIGETMFLSGLCMFAAAPICGKLITKLDPRAMIGLGFLGFALGAFFASSVTSTWGFDDLILPQVLRGFSAMMVMVAVNNLTLGTLPPERLKNAAGLYNLTRNLGGAVGLALINTSLNNRMDLHLARLHDKVSWSNTAALEALANLTQKFSTLGSDAELMALKQLTRQVRQQGMVMAIGDVFFGLALLFASLVVLLPLMKRPKPVAISSDAH